MHSAEIRQTDSSEFVQESARLKRLIRLRRITLAALVLCITLCAALFIGATVMDLGKFTESLVANTRLLFYLTVSAALIFSM